ncbi:MAG: aspartate aminotransferase family protein [Methylacidiphilales bacterium]|nr:aspartate aminotransferase family protein [Candidatus Methylacidiphilales bacterium]
MKQYPSPSLSNSYFMPFTANRQFRHTPRLLHKAKGMYYEDIHGRKIIDGTAGLWCCNAGHSRKEISVAVETQLNDLDFALSFQVSHPLAFSLADSLVKLTPEPLKHVFYTNSGSESVDTALKLTRAYWQAKGMGTKTMFVGREKGYHGVGFGGISVGGLVNNRSTFTPLLPSVDHLPHTHIPENKFSKGMGKHRGLELADELLKVINLHGAHNIGAVIVEPIAGSAGVIVPPVGYLERLREITKNHGILLIFDEVITGFGRVGKPFASNRFSVVPDIITTAKGLTNGVIPMGAVFFSREIFDTLSTRAETIFEFFHGYTYSGHPVACAAAQASLEIYQHENLFEKAIDLEDHFASKLHDLNKHSCVTDVRTIGLMGAVDFSPLPSSKNSRAYQIFENAFWNGTLTRCTGDTIALSPPLIASKDDITKIIEGLSEAITEVSKVS